jgi:hypothetical protein
VAAYLAKKREARERSNSEDAESMRGAAKKLESEPSFNDGHRLDGGHKKEQTTAKKQNKDQHAADEETDRPKEVAPVHKAN